MPLYDYRCRKCLKEFETLVFQGDIPECPHCGSKDLERKPSVFFAHGAGKVSSGRACSHCHSGKCSTCN